MEDFHVKVAQFRQRLDFRKPKSLVGLTKADEVLHGCNYFLF